EADHDHELEGKARPDPRDIETRLARRAHDARAAPAAQPRLGHHRSHERRVEFVVIHKDISMCEDRHSPGGSRANARRWYPSIVPISQASPAHSSIAAVRASSGDFPPVRTNWKAGKKRSHSVMAISNMSS